MRRSTYIDREWNQIYQERLKEMTADRDRLQLENEQLRKQLKATEMRNAAVKPQDAFFKKDNS